MKYESLLLDFKNGPALLEASLVGIAKEEALYKPRRDGAWSIQEHVLHLVDSEANNFVRLKSIMAQTGSEVFVIDEEEWTRRLDYAREDMGKYLKLFSLLREITVDYLSGVPEALWESSWFHHRDLGKVSLSRCVEIYAKHVGFHAEYIDALRKEYAERGSES